MDGQILESLATAEIVEPPSAALIINPAYAEIIYPPVSALDAIDGGGTTVVTVVDIDGGDSATTSWPFTLDGGAP